MHSAHSRAAGYSKRPVMLQVHYLLLLSLQQEHLHFVTEISQDEIFILDPEMVMSQQVGTPPGMPDLVVEQATG